MGAYTGALAGLALSGACHAGELACVAQAQCRGDAQAMCAPSSLKIKVSAENRLWIDAQGPYGARLSREGDARVWTIRAFGGAHALRVEADGAFLYLGNRGKRYRGTCREVIQ
ncbi:hypothetical protein [Rhodalgimonas zhirmunskyi]|uniref:C-type lysozyme inhibitor domain-containing protein n=1 Tax=Rhodalgimonas zhirmunskyi TaxID=2964767 RepID=A0AAJ1U338_9RHOB|nr:hypothetical protein [Rhodoalgimonas zhirmunskyi]MDQ2092770.1 hypothetical protein [Rhodoalgimonas zhirmunskyi]